MPKLGYSRSSESQPRRRWPIVLIGLLIVILVAIYPTGNLITKQLYAAKASDTLNTEANFLVKSSDHAERVGISNKYGTVKSASVRDVDSRLFDSRTAYGYLVLYCSTGMAVLRADMKGPVGNTRLTSIVAQEVSPWDLPRGLLSASELGTYSNDFARRTQVKQHSFVLQYGDQ